MLNKIKFFLKKPTLVVIFGSERKKIKKIISRALKNHFILNKDIFIFEAGEEKTNNFSFFFKNAKLSVLAISSLSQDFSFNGLPPLARFVLNYGDQKTKEEKSFNDFKNIKYGFDEKNDVIVSDIKKNEETNLKINYKGSIVPFWFKKKLDEKEISIILCVISIAITVGLNLVEISQALKQVDLD